MITILAFTFSLPVYANSVHEIYMKKLNFKYVSPPLSVNVENSTISVTYHGASIEESQKTFNIIKKSMEMSPKFLRKNGKNTSRICKDYDIDVYDIPKETLNDHNVMKFINNGKPFQRITALYDSIDSSPERSSIFISESYRQSPGGESELSRKMIISHEILHYWQERTCNNKNIKEMESAAARFENVFTMPLRTSSY
jgi:hypothetical protein